MRASCVVNRQTTRVDTLLRSDSQAEASNSSISKSEIRRHRHCLEKNTQLYLCSVQPTPMHRSMNQP